MPILNELCPSIKKSFTIKREETSFPAPAFSIIGSRTYESLVRVLWVYFKCVKDSVYTSKHLRTFRYIVCFIHSIVAADLDDLQCLLQHLLRCLVVVKDLFRFSRNTHQSQLFLLLGNVYSSVAVVASDIFAQHKQAMVIF